MEEGYALKLNRDAQVNMLNAAVPLMPEGSRVVFVTSHQAHFINTVPTMPDYEPVARSKRAGEDALRGLVPSLAEKGISLVVVSGDMIEGTVTATLLDRSNPGAIEARRAEAGKLYSVRIRRRGRQDGHRRCRERPHRVRRRVRLLRQEHELRRRPYTPKRD